MKELLILYELLLNFKYKGIRQNLFSINSKVFSIVILRIDL